MIKREIYNFIECMTTWQGEGPDSGKQMLLVRFKECNMNCYFCDTKVKMRTSISAMYSSTDIQHEIDKHKCGLLITGGEPTFKNNLQMTIDLINQIKFPFANVETNGFRLNELINSTKDKAQQVKFIFSPKIFSERMFYDNIEIINNVVKDDRVFIKLVIDKKERDSFAHRFLNHIIDKYPKLQYRTYLMPEGKTREEIINNSPIVFDLCERYGVNFSSRQHIIYNFI